MKLVKGKVSFIRDNLWACIIFPLIFGKFYSYVMSGSNWSEVNQTIGIILIVLFIYKTHLLNIKLQRIRVMLR